MAFVQTETVKMYKGKEVILVDKDQVASFEAAGYSDTKPVAKEAEKPATPPATQPAK